MERVTTFLYFEPLPRASVTSAATILSEGLDFERARLIIVWNSDMVDLTASGKRASAQLSVRDLVYESALIRFSY